ncbi:MAG: hypothetical protein R6V44_03570 [Paracoccaceae bacterium]
MRVPAPFLFAVAGFAAVWAEAALPPGSPPPAPAALPATEIGLAGALVAAGAAPLPGLAAAWGEDGVWRLRGRAPLIDGPAAGWPAPLYAEVRPICDAHLERPRCWRVLRLELDGAPLAPETAAWPEPDNPEGGLALAPDGRATLPSGPRP